MGWKRLSLCLTWVVCLAHTSDVLSHVKDYEVVRPRRLPARWKRSPQLGQPYPDTVRYELALGGRNHTIHLEKNRNLFGSDYTETHYSEDGKRITFLPEMEHCYYQGHFEGIKDSSVSVGMCSGISGFLRARQQVYLIEPLGQSEDGEHAVYRPEQLKVGSQPGYGATSNPTSNTTSRLFDREQAPRPAALLGSRSQKLKSIKGPSRFVELFVVVDNTECEQYGSQTRSRILQVINHVDLLYRPLNMRVLLVGLEMWTHKDLIDIDVNPETTLDNFLLWRRTDLLKRRKHDTAQFVTGKDFDGDTVGLANKFAMCTENSGGVNQDHHDSPIGLASTIAHEMGHNFGLSHDAPGCLCHPSHGNEDCVMADKLRTGSQTFPEFFSDCSMDQFTEFMNRAQPTCLSQPASSVRVIAVGPLCGNALLDAGEECDCGTAEECRNPCCDASTCRLTEGSQCAHGQCCEKCQLKQTGSVCRASAGKCDLPEYCTGASQDCPDDSFEMNGKPCYNQAEGYCHDGQCPTHQQHCWRLFGQGAEVGPDMCFDLNRMGKEGANCGRSRSGYTPCTRQNLKCGSMFCIRGGESISGKRAVFNRASVECKLAVDDDKTRNIDMVPKGTRCEPNKVCLDNRCVDVSVYGLREQCEKKCNNNGVCNHKRECHCNPGWAPPFCDIQYADLPQGQSELMAIVGGVLAAALLIAAVIVALVCYKKSKRKKYTSKRKVYSAPDKLNPMFQEQSGKDRFQISQPTFKETTASQACTPLILAPSRPPPQPPKKIPAMSSPSQTEPKQPQPPSKPLPPLNKTQLKAVKPPAPPVSAVKPSPPAVVRTKPGAPPLPPAKPPPHRLTRSSP
ncbi:zinc metalloproteinase-disintegrin-like VMP-III isoform X2 [Nelusetta ayraudi]|uniref:zinc metalloproteinase-disintegrin-like VMP-III isoform X2 n=1 Tax=Nelusetta ayraudi TaxID=303726 RepID=UPI003F71EE62